MKWIKTLIRLLGWIGLTVVIAGAVLFVATRSKKTIGIRVNEYRHLTGRYCALIVEEDRDWRRWPGVILDKVVWREAWRASLFVGRDCEQRQDEGIWTDIGWDWGEDATNQIAGGFTDEGFTIIRRDGRSTFIPRGLYLQKAK